jgi:hypothetical protein
MPWKFDAILGDLVFKIPPTDISDPANVDLGAAGASDLGIDTGERINDSSTVDQGLRVFEVDGG